MTAITDIEKKIDMQIDFIIDAMLDNGMSIADIGRAIAFKARGSGKTYIISKYIERFTLKCIIIPPPVKILARARKTPRTRGSLKHLRILAKFGKPQKTSKDLTKYEQTQAD